MRRAAICAVTVAVLASGCGDDGGGDAVSPDEWADSVCTSFGDFLDGVNAPLEDLVELAQNPGADAAQAAAQAEVAAGAYARFGEEVGTIVAAIEDAGVPDVEGGAEFRDGLVEALTRAGDVVEDARRSLEELEGGESTFDEVTEVVEAQFAEFNAALEDVDFDFSEDAPPEVQTAFEESATCRGVRSRFEVQE